MASTAAMMLMVKRTPFAFIGWQEGSVSAVAHGKVKSMDGPRRGHGTNLTACVRWRAASAFVGSVSGSKARAGAIRQQPDFICGPVGKTPVALWHFVPVVPDLSTAVYWVRHVLCKRMGSCISISCCAATLVLRCCSVARWLWRPGSGGQRCCK